MNGVEGNLRCPLGKCDTGPERSVRDASHRGGPSSGCAGRRIDGPGDPFETGSAWPSALTGKRVASPRRSRALPVDILEIPVVKLNPNYHFY